MSWGGSEKNCWCQLDVFISMFWSSSWERIDIDRIGRLPPNAKGLDSSFFTNLYASRQTHKAWRSHCHLLLGLKQGYPLYSTYGCRLGNLHQKPGWLLSLLVCYSFVNTDHPVILGNIMVVMVVGAVVHLTSPCLRELVNTTQRRTFPSSTAKGQRCPEEWRLHGQSPFKEGVERVYRTPKYSKVWMWRRKELLPWHQGTRGFFRKLGKLFFSKALDTLVVVKDQYSHTVYLNMCIK